MNCKKLPIYFAASLAFIGMSAGAQAQQGGVGEMTFFITSVGPGNGGDLGGLAGADAHCLKLAQEAGTAAKVWAAYLSTQEKDGQKAINARDRIGKGPWQNARGVVVAKSVDDLHSANNKLSKANSLDEKGQPVNGRGDKPNRHDILTGTQADGTAFPPGEDRT